MIHILISLYIIYFDTRAYKYYAMIYAEHQQRFCFATCRSIVVEECLLGNLSSLEAVKPPLSSRWPEAVLYSGKYKYNGNFSLNAYTVFVSTPVQKFEIHLNYHQTYLKGVTSV